MRPRPWFLPLRPARLLVLALAAGLVGTMALQAQQQVDEEAVRRRAEGFNARAEAYLAAEPFRGIATAEGLVTGLFPLGSSGVSTAPVQAAAEAFLAALDDGQRAAIQFPVDDLEWRRWANQSIYDFSRQGLALEAMDSAQREAALGLLRASLSAKGLDLAQDIMHLNHTLGELNGDNFFEYGDGKYWFSIMGEPSTNEPWGWQLDGHHLNLNYFVLGDQVVMTPAFWGSEPAVAEGGKYAGTAIMEDEQRAGLELVRLLDEEQRARAVLATAKTGNDILTQAFSDNVIIDYAGINAGSLNEEQKARLVNLVRLYVNNLREGHAQVRMTEVVEHLDDTWFAWIGGMEDDSVFYYRIQSPVLLIEFDHQTPVGLTHLYPPGVPFKEHIHAVVRTPNGNDYGKDLLRQHYESHPH